MNKGYLFIMMLSLFSCGEVVKEVEFRKIDNLDVKEWSMDNVTVSADISFFNPNKVGIFLERFSFNVFVNDREVATINQEVKTELAASKVFISPMIFSFSPKQIFKKFGMSPLEIGLEILTKKELEIMYKGNAIVSKAGMELKVPVEEIIFLKK